MKLFYLQEMENQTAKVKFLNLYLKTLVQIVSIEQRTHDISWDK